MSKYKIIPSISSSYDVLSKLNKTSYMCKNNVAEHIEFYFAININNINKLDNLDKILKVYDYLDYSKKDDVVHQKIMNNYIEELHKEKIFIETTCLVTPREVGDDVEVENGISANNSCISLTLILHDNEEDIFGKFFRHPIYYQDKKSKYNIWAITEVEELKDYNIMMYVLDFLRLRLCLRLRAQLKKKKTNISLNIHKYNFLTLLLGLRFIPIQYSRSNLKLLIVKKDKFYKDLVKNPLKKYIYMSFDYNVNVTKE